MGVLVDGLEMAGREGLTVGFARGVAEDGLKVEEMDNREGVVEGLTVVLVLGTAEDGLKVGLRVDEREVGDRDGFAVRPIVCFK